MFKQTKNSYHAVGAAMTIGMMMSSVGTANATPAAGAGTGTTTTAGGNNFGSIATNITSSISQLPGLISAISYLFGVLLAVLGIMKIKDHVENPTQTPLKDGAMRLAAGGALFAIPMVMEAMTNTIGSGSGASAAQLNAVTMSVAP